MTLTSTKNYIIELFKTLLVVTACCGIMYLIVGCGDKNIDSNVEVKTRESESIESTETEHEKHNCKKLSCEFPSKSSKE